VTFSTQCVQHITAFFHVVGPEVHERLRTLNKCPLQRARWCVISDYEMMKCENMIMAYAAKNLRPDLNCIRGSSVQDCMYKINTGDADLITLDAADVYFAGKSVFTFRLAFYCINSRTSFHEKSLRLCHFKLDWDEIFLDCSSSKYALID